MINLVQIGALLGASFSIGLGAIGSAVGEGFIAGKTVGVLSRQPSAGGKLFRTMLISQAVTETAGIFALVVALVLIFQEPSGGFLKAIAYISAGLCMGLGAIGSGFGAGIGGGEACQVIARNPDKSEMITIYMLIGQAVTQTTAIYAMVVALILIFVV